MKKKKIAIITSIALIVLIIVIGFGYVQSKAG
jgi:flagellar biosynthesis/type III secretory pathway M-ring protein FliF/YscJ